MNIKLNGGYDVAFTKKSPYMMFGSIMNVYGRNIEGSKKNVEEILKDAQKIWEFCVERTIEIQNKIYDAEHSVDEDEISKFKQFTRGF